MNSSDLFINFVINLLAGVVGILIVLWIERQRRPQLFLTVGKKHSLSTDDPLGRPPAKWLYVEVHNKSMPRWLAGVYNREPAFSCKAWITFYHLDGHTVYEREMQARWSETPEPFVQILEVDKRQPNNEPLTATPPAMLAATHTEQERIKAAKLLNVQETVDIPPGESTNMDVVFRVDGEEHCYGWCNESYLYGWRHPDWKLEKGRYFARIRVKTGGKEFVKAFLIANDVPYQDFRLEEVDNTTLKKLK